MRQPPQLDSSSVSRPPFAYFPGLSGIVSTRKSSDWEDVLFLQYFGEKTTPLHNAVLGGHEDIVEMLLAHDPKPDVNRGTLQKGTAAHIAAWKSTPHILELLKQSGADLTLRTSTGWLPIHCAAVHGNEATIQWLLNNGASINSMTTSGETALHLAAQYGLYHTAKLLLDSHATIDVKTVDGLTPLHIAAESGQDNLVLVLLLYNADPDMLTMDGKNAVQLAEGAHKSSTVQILQSAERMEKDREGRMTSEENFGIPYIGTPQIKLPALVLSAIKTGLSKMEAVESKKALPHRQRHDEDDHELSRHGNRSQHHHHHERNDELDENVQGKMHHKRAPSRKSSVRFDDDE